MLLEDLEEAEELLKIMVPQEAEEVTLAAAQVKTLQLQVPQEAEEALIIMEPIKIILQV